MNTPDTEKAELAVFWDEIAQHLPKSIERSALGDEKIFCAFATAYPKMKKHLVTSRDTYWKERVRKEVEESLTVVKLRIVYDRRQNTPAEETVQDIYDSIELKLTPHYQYIRSKL